MQAREHDVLPENRSDAVVTATLSGKQNKKEEEPPSSGRKSAEKPKRKMIVEVEIKPLTLNQSDRGVVHTNIEGMFV
jgi:hypothetical protein